MPSTGSKVNWSNISDLYAQLNTARTKFSFSTVSPTNRQGSVTQVEDITRLNSFITEMSSHSALSGVAVGIAPPERGTLMYPVFLNDLFSQITQIQNSNASFSDSSFSFGNSSFNDSSFSFGNSSFGNSSFSDSSFSFGNSSFGNSSFGNSSFGNSSFSDSGWSFGNSSFSDSSFGDSSFGNSSFSCSSWGFGNSSFGNSSWGNSSWKFGSGGGGDIAFKFSWG